MPSTLSLRFAAPSDCQTILSFIKALADYEKLSDAVVASEEMIRSSLFPREPGCQPQAEVVLASLDGKDIGFALFFHNYSTFLGRRGLYLEDLFVLPEARGTGAGKALLQFLAQVALKRGCGRMEWWVLNWNTPAIDFYKSLGAEPMDEWTPYRLTGAALEKLAGDEF